MVYPETLSNKALTSENSPPHITYGSMPNRNDNIHESTMIMNPSCSDMASDFLTKIKGNAPAIKGAIYFNASDIASGSFSLKPDENIYFTPPDFAVSVKWDYDRWHIEGEINDWVSQLIWMSKVKGLDFKWWYIPDIRVAYDVSDGLTLSLLYENDMLGLGFECGGFTADLLTKLDRFAIGIRMGYVM